MKKIVRLTENDLIRLVKRTINEMDKKEDYQFSFDIKSVKCKDGPWGNGHVDIDDDGNILIRYCEGDEDTLEYLKEKGKRLVQDRFGINPETGELKY